MTRARSFENTKAFLGVLVILFLLSVLFLVGNIQRDIDFLIVRKKLISIHFTRGSERQEALRLLYMTTKKYGPLMWTKVKDAYDPRDGFIYLHEEEIQIMKIEYIWRKKECIEHWNFNEKWLPSFE